MNIAFTSVLAIVEGALDRDGMDVGGVDRRHLPPLHVGDAAVRVEDEDVDALEPLEGVDRRAAGVARGRADDGGALAAQRFRTWSISRAEQLHRHVLEGERRAVEELEHEEIVAELRQRADGRMAEGGIGRRDHRAQRLGASMSPSIERADDALGDLGVGLAGESRDLVARRAPARLSARRGRRRGRGRPAARR